MTKSVIGYEEYEFKGTEYVSVETDDGWIYRFNRPESCVPYTFEMKQRPDGTTDESKNRVPSAVVEFMERKYDSAQLHPERKKKTDRWGK